MNLNLIGWTANLENEYSLYRQQNLEAARVIHADRGTLTITTIEGNLRATLAGRLDPDGENGPAVAGDWVAVDLSADTAVVRSILPRQGQLTRRRPGAAERSQTVAANISHVVIVEAVDRGPNRRRIERGVSIAFGGGATPLVVLTKADLSGSIEDNLAEAAAAAPFSDIIALSAATGFGIEQLVDHLGAGVTAVLLGPSGTGKSTLANRLLGEDRLAVGHVREGDSKGRHTTTRSELIRLPSGACLIDTPGVRELGLWLDAEDVNASFADIEEFAQHCRFRDCSHDSEHGCAVIAATQTGELDRSRLEGFHKLRREAEALEIRRDASRLHEQRKRDKSFAKLCRSEMKRKGLK